MRREILLNIALMTALLCYCFIGYEGGDLNGYCIEFVLWNAADLDIVFGILPLLGLIAILVSLIVENKAIIYPVGFLLLTAPIVADVLLYDRVALYFAEFYLPFAAYLIISVFCFILVFNKNARTRQFIGNPEF